MPMYQSKPLKVEAVKYEPPSAHDRDDGNVDELDDLAGTLLQQQAPWNPAEGQNCLLLVTPAEPTAHDVDGNPTAYSEPVRSVVKPGDYLVKTTDGALAVADGAQFEDAWSLVGTERPAQHSNPPAVTP